MRPSRQQMFIMMARAAAMRSTCFRLNVGAIVVIDNRPVSLGYNGAPAGRPHCTGNACPGRLHCRETLHAEVNALEHVPWAIEGSDTRYSGRHWDLYTTHSPCEECLSRIVDEGMVKRIFFEVPYRKTTHMAGLKSTYGIEIYQVNPAGYVVEYDTGDVVEL